MNEKKMTHYKISVSLASRQMSNKKMPAGKEFQVPYALLLVSSSLIKLFEPANIIFQTILQ